MRAGFQSSQTDGRSQAFADAVRADGDPRQRGVELVQQFAFLLDTAEQKPAVLLVSGLIHFIGQRAERFNETPLVLCQALKRLVALLFEPPTQRIDLMTTQPSLVVAVGAREACGRGAMSAGSHTFGVKVRSELDLRHLA